mgnify:CR=1 FL=1
MSLKAETPLYRVLFVNQDKVFEIYAKQIYQSDLYGFLEVEELVFGERSALVVDPSEEKLKAEFQGVKRTYIPVHAIVRVDEVERVGVTRVREGSAKVTPIHFAAPRDFD